MKRGVGGFNSIYREGVGGVGEQDGSLLYAE